MLVVGVAGPRNRTSVTQIPPAPQPGPLERHETPDRCRSSALKVQFHVVRRKANPHDQLELSGIVPYRPERSISTYTENGTLRSFRGWLLTAAAAFVIADIVQRGSGLPAGVTIR
jgi:hypothetical protein